MPLVVFDGTNLYANEFTANHNGHSVVCEYCSVMDNNIVLALLESSSLFRRVIIFLQKKIQSNKSRIKILTINLKNLFKFKNNLKNRSESFFYHNEPVINLNIEICAVAANPHIPLF